MKKIIGTFTVIFVIFGSTVCLWAQPKTAEVLREKYRRWLEEEVAYILHSSERQVFLKLETDQDRDLFIDSFWKQRDPTPETKENEFKIEHYRRLKFVDSRFSTKSSPGWKTDWGRLYIILGNLYPGLRLYEGLKEKGQTTVSSVSGSFLHHTISATVDAEDDIAKEKSRLKDTFNLEDVRLVTDFLFRYQSSWEGKTIHHMIELEGKNYLFSLGHNWERERLFGLKVSKLNESDDKVVMEIIWDTEIVLPEDKAAIFGFQTENGQTLFLSLRIPPILREESVSTKSRKQRVRPHPLSTQEMEDDVVKVEGQIPPPKRIKYVAPHYPEIAKQAKVEGVVMLGIRTDKQGKVEAIKVLRSIPLLDKAAIDAVRKWEYEPLMIDEKIYKAAFTVSLRFSGDGLSIDVSSIRIPPDFLGDAVRIEEDVARRMLIKYVEPIYPLKARQGRVEGFVVLGVRINESGEVEDIKVLRSIPVFDKAAADAVKQWIYQPPIINGESRKIAFIVSVRFQLI